MKNIFKTFLNIFIKPISTTNEEVEKATIKFGFIHAGIITAIFTFCNFISTVISQIFVDKYDYSARKYVTKLVLDEIDILSLVGSFFGTALLTFGFIMACAGIMFLVAKIFKAKTTFAKTLKISTFALTPYMVAKFLSLIFAWFSPIASTVIVIAQIYFVFIALFAFAKIIGEQNHDKLALSYIILLGGLAFIGSLGMFILELIGSDLIDLISF